MPMPANRKALYLIWRACERFGILPPTTRSRWEDCNPDGQSALIAYEQIRQREDFDEKKAFAGVK